MNIQTRIEKIEQRLGVNNKPETLEIMLQKYEAGEYGKHAMMSLVVGANHAEDLNVFHTGLKKLFPDLLAEYFMDCLILAYQVEGQRDRRPDESKGDYLNYLIQMKKGLQS